jgi:signal transduction histidine kinase
MKNVGFDTVWNILLVEDDKEDYILTREMLSVVREGKYKIEWSPDYEAGKRAILAGNYDAILMDYELGMRTGLELTSEVTSLGCKAPIILLTGRGNYELDMQAMRAGVTDYLGKSEATPASLERTIRYAILQKQTEEFLKAAKEELESRVQERTLELSTKNAALETEVKERMRVELELAELQRSMIDQNEAERRELARELHDGPMQELYGLVFQLETLNSDFQNGRGNETVETMRQKMLQVIQSLRGMSRELRPPALAPYGLEKAIRSHAEYLQQAHPDLKIKLELDSDGQSLPEPVRLALFRIYQTAITNVIRHARAKRALVQLRLNDDHAEMLIQDNGCGFYLPKRWIELARQGHMGLVGAMERAEAAGGKLKVHTQPGKGTRIQVTVPRDKNGDNKIGEGDLTD